MEHAYVIVNVEFNQIPDMIGCEYMCTHFKRDDDLEEGTGRFKYHINDNDIDEFFEYMKNFLYEHLPDRKYSAAIFITANYCDERGRNLRVYAREYRCSCVRKIESIEIL